MNDILELINFDYIENEIGDSIKEKTYTEIFAEKKNIKQSEFYQAQSTGLKPELKFEVNAFEYNNETHIRYEDKEYKVLRTYQVNADKIEITLEGVING